MVVFRKSRRSAAILNLTGWLVVFLLLNFISGLYFFRFDLTAEKRYTLAPATRKMLSELKDEIYFKVYLSGDVNPAFTRLRNATREMLDEFSAYSHKKVQYDFVRPGEGLTREETTALEKQLYEKGLIPEQISARGQGKVTQALIWPGALVSHRGKETVWQIYSRQSPGIELETAANNSVEELEYGLANTIRKLQRERKPEVTFLQGHHELDTLSQFDLMRSLGEYYRVNYTRIAPGHELRTFSGSDAIVISKPDSAFTDKEKYVIDQFIMNGGKVLWLIDPVQLSMDSLRKGFTIGFNRALGIEEMLFKYGVRINPVLVQDLQCGFLNINVGFKNGQPKFQLFPWIYAPLVLPLESHPIVKNLDMIKFDFSSTLDTIASARGIKKTILLRSSRYARTQITPARVSLAIVQSPPSESQFREKFLPLGCLLEGSFTSFTENRMPAELTNDPVFKHRSKGKPTKMIVVADGDVAANDVQKSNGQAFPLGYDRNTRQTFANKKFLLNCMNYLLDDENMLQLRSREVKLRLLDKKKLLARGKWQFINLALPLLLVIGYGLVSHFLRRRKYATTSA
jgi:ABC-2 type transport system permease protein